MKIESEENTKISYMAKPGEIDVQIIFNYDEELLKEVVSKLLVDKGLSIAVAESCTGGLIATQLTDIPGSSSYFLGGIVAYHNDLKVNFLGVSTDTLGKYGAVSKETAIEMAQGIRKRSGANLGLAVTGIAGPSGGSSDKPVGLVFIALETDDKILCREFRFPGRRQAVRQGTAVSALNMLRQYLSEIN